MNPSSGAPTRLRSLALGRDPDRMGVLPAAIDALPVGVTVVELAPDGTPRFVIHSSAFDRMAWPLPGAGVPAEDLPYQVFLPDRTTPVPVEDWPGPRAARTGTPIHDAEVHVRQRGTWRVFSASAAPIPRADPGDPLRAVTVYLDITDRVEQARQVEEVKARLSHVIDGSNDGFFDWDLGTDRLKFSRGLAAMLGYDLGELGTDPVAVGRLVHPDDRERSRAAAEGHRRGESERIDLELRLRHREDRWLWVLVRGKVVERDAGGRPLQIAGTVTDVTRRRAAEEELQLQRTRLDVASRSGGMGLWDLDLRTNQAWRTIEHDRLFGYDELQPSWGPDEALRHVVPEDRPVFRRAFDEALATGHFHYELRIVPSKGALRWLEAKGEVLRDEAGKPVRMAGSVSDVTGRKVAEARIREAAAYARSLIEASIDPLVVIGPDGRITDVNAASEEATGVPRESLLGADFTGYVTEPEKARSGFEQALAGGAVHDFPLAIRHSSGRATEVIFNASVFRTPEGRVGGVFAAARDVSVLRATQEQLAIASRLAALGRLVAAVAHQINNPLAAQISGQGLALEVLREVRAKIAGSSIEDRVGIVRNLDEASEALEDAQAGGQRIARIVKDLSILGRPEPHRSRVRIADVVDDALRWMPGSVTASSSLKVEHVDAPEVMASSAQLEQVVVNLVTNAAQAAAPGTRGDIVIRTGPGSHGTARLEVADRGVGIDPKYMPPLFEPFFTTRPAGQERGTGLGLAVAHSIVTAHGGTLSVESEPGTGTTFRLELPAAAH